jgi:cytochrome c peroxidase
MLLLFAESKLLMTNISFLPPFSRLRLEEFFTSAPDFTPMRHIRLDTPKTAWLRALLLSVLLLPAAAADADDRALFRRPTAIPFPADAPYNREIAVLGKMLFFDPRLSSGQNISCSSCHSPSFGWEGPVPKAIGAANTPLARHAPTVLNAAWISPLFWDGRAATLEEQAAGPITAPDEMNANFDDLKLRLGAVPQYRAWFNRLFPGQGIGRESILTALATYQRTIVSGEAAFDRWVEGDDSAIGPSAKRGFALFTGKGGCSNCHTGWMFTDNGMHDVGLDTSDPGRGGLPGHEVKDEFNFKTPGLRNIALRAPYMHDGSLPSLRRVVRHYAEGGAQGIARTAEINAFQITPQEEDDLIAFLETLTDPSSSVPAPILPAN